MQELEYMHGNFVLIPQTVYKSIGIIDGYYSHAGGDGDYSMTAIKNGFKVYTTKDFCGKCKLDTPVPQCFKIETPIFKRFMILYTPLSYSMPKEIFYFDCKHKNIFIAIMHVVSVHIRCLFPKLLVKRLTLSFLFFIDENDYLYSYFITLFKEDVNNKKIN